MNTSTNDKSILKEITINAPINLVWSAWTISERVAEWFAPEANIEAKLNGAFELYFIPGNETSMNTKGCKITKYDYEELLHFTWKGPDQFETIMNNVDDLTTVKVKFESIGGNSTKVILEHVGFKHSEYLVEAIQWHEMAWSGVLQSLKAAIEKGEGNLCCQP